MVGGKTNESRKKGVGFTVKGMEIPDSRECIALRVVKTTVCGEEDERVFKEGTLIRSSWMT